MSETATPLVPSRESEMKRLQEAFVKWDEEANRLQRKQKRFGFFTALLGPVAVLLLTVQVLVFPHGGTQALILIFAEMTALGIALVFGFFQIEFPDTWMRCRLRAEVLRRERFLVIARVGPYLETLDPAYKIKQRLAMIDSVNRDPVELVPLQEPAGSIWHEALEDARSSQTVTAPPDPDCFDLFYKERLLHQKKWFSDRSADFGRIDKRFEDIAKGVLVLALVVSVWHLATLYFGDHALVGAERTASQLTIEILAIVLPPVGAAAIALQSLLEGRRLSRSYADRERLLTNIETALVGLHPEMAASNSQTPEHRERCEFQLKRLVLRTEAVLASDFLQWWLLRHN